MKKISFVLAILVLVTCLFGCGQKPEVTDDTQQTTSTTIEEPLYGGWSTNRELSFNLPKDATIAFNAVNLSDDEGQCVPIACLGTQVVAGTNYAFLCLVGDASFVVEIVYANVDGSYGLVSTTPFDLLKYVGEDAQVGAEELAGGWTTVDEEGTNQLDETAQKVFDSAFDGFAGTSYSPIACLATQVVAGTNYAFLAVGTTMTAEPIVYPCVVTVYEDLDGNVELTNVCGIDLADFN